MKVGDLVRRNTGGRLGIGLILSLQPGGTNPVHPCATVYYPQVRKTWDIAVSLVEVISECR